MEKVLDVFYSSTEDAAGQLDPEKFQQVLERLGLEGADALQLFEVADLNRDGRIDCREFIEWLFGDSGGFQISGHPQSAVNRGAFTRSRTDPEANGQPHYENGSWHIFFSFGKWRIARGFEPTKTNCWSYIEPTQSGTIPEGDNEWDACVDGSWTKVSISVTRLSSSDLATMVNEKSKATVEQARGNLRVQGHPLEGVNCSAFTRSEEVPTVNGFPHYENGWHLYFSLGKWRIASKFAPTESSCWSYIDPTPSGCVPEGENEWDAYVDGSWTKVKITVSSVDASATTELDCKDAIEPFHSPSADGKPILCQDAYEEVCKMCMEQNAKFIDADFPPIASSLMQSGDSAEYQVDGWKRFSDLCNDPFVYDEVAGHDINQGAVGDCYMCTVLNAVAVTHFELIKAVFSNRPDANACGCYSLRLCHPQTKQWVYVLVDDYVPVRYGKPCFLKSSNQNEMWCSLFEKAVAKLTGRYSGIDARSSPMPSVLNSYGTREIMEMITGSVGLSNTVWTQQKPDAELWSMLQQFVINRWPITTSCAATVEGQRQEGKDNEAGLVRHHSYSLVGAVQMPCGERLVRIRNPWACFEWKGKWGDGDTENWTEENRAFVDSVPEGGGELGHSSCDGMFFIPLKDYIESFQYFQYCPIVGDSVWDRVMEEQADALQEQSRGGLQFSGHPKDGVNLGHFTLSQEQPEVNEKPHYENGSWHLYFSLGQWRVSQGFDPTSAKCWSHIDPTQSGTIPEGDNEWDACVDGSWTKVSISVTHLSSSDLAALTSENARAVEEQAKRSLCFQGHPKDAVNCSAFTRSEEVPTVNGFPHYENGWHLYFSLGKWRIASNFEPTESSCWSYIDPTPSGCVPEGDNEWDAYADGSWTKVMISMTCL